uniref:Uncharacterized protein n=1 Tax=Arundo donax TaxID=35708 RepID=A0A0A8YYZ7_ARUDO
MRHHTRRESEPRGEESSSTARKVKEDPPACRCQPLPRSHRRCRSILHV